jgi:hypothetical protein
MKGFVYLLEIAIAAILMVVVLSTFFAIRVKQEWSTADLIDSGNNILNYISQNSSFFINILNENLTDIEKVKPANIDYGLNVKGSPKSNITVGCPSQCIYVNSLLTDVYVNGRWIYFNVEPFDITGGIPDHLDAVVLIGYGDSEYNNYRDEIEDYLNKGGTVIGINDAIDNNNFLDIFGLQEVTT